MPEEGSRAPYIIICNGRIDVELAKSGFEAIQAASRTAERLVCYYGERLTNADTKPISDLQHRMMQMVSGRAQHAIGSTDMVDDMFALLDALEDKMKS